MTCENMIIHVINNVKKIQIFFDQSHLNGQ